MRHPLFTAFPALVCVLVATLPGSAAVAEPGAEPAPTPGKKLCEFSDPALAEISGLVATKDGYSAVPDSGELLEVFDLNRKCQVVQRHSFQVNPFAPEDLALADDGTLWAADVGDTNLERETVALWKIPADRSVAEIHRLTYPDGKHDAEALLLPPDGKPIIITKDLNGGGVSGIYVANQPLQGEQSVPMKKVGELKLDSTGTGGNRFGPVGQKLVTGAAMSADGSRAVVRTYADAYEWRVSKGNVTKALTKGEPVRTPLPGELQGESITIGPDGKFITASEAVDNEPARMFRHTPTPPPAKKPKPGAAANDGPGWFDQLDLQDFKLLIAMVGVCGLVLVLVGVWGIRRSRRPGGRRNAVRPAEVDETAELNLRMQGFERAGASRSGRPRPARGGPQGRRGVARVSPPRDEGWGAAGAGHPRAEPPRRGRVPRRGDSSLRGESTQRWSPPRPGSETPRPRYSRGVGDDPRYGRPSGGSRPY